MSTLQRGDNKHVMSDTKETKYFWEGTSLIENYYTCIFITSISVNVEDT